VSLSRLVEDVLGLNRFQLYSPYKALFEQAEQQRLVNQLQENLGTEQNMAAQMGSQPQQQPVASGGPTGPDNVVARMSIDQTRANAKQM
jgi:hypothetical protein